MTNRFRCERVLPITAHTEFKRSFINAYKEAFKGPPYFETYTDDEVLEEVLIPHLERGLVMIVSDLENDGKLVGFGCAMPYRYCPEDVQTFLEQLAEGGHLPKEFDHQNSWYMSELGVLNEYRGLGTAWELVLQRMRSVSHNGVRQFFMRTDAVNSNSKPMYVKSGARELPIWQDLSGSDQLVENGSRSKSASTCGAIAVSQSTRSARSGMKRGTRPSHRMSRVPRRNTRTRCNDRTSCRQSINTVRGGRRPDRSLPSLL